MTGVRFIEVREVDLAGLEPFPGNPRRGNVGEIRKSLRRLGQYRSLVVRVINGHQVILAGNHTSKAMALEGWTTARAELVECDDDEARRINAADNKLGELPDPDTGERYDPESLVELLSSFDGDFEGTGWAEEDLAALLSGDDDGAPGSGAPPDSADLPPGEDKYREQYGVIVICATEAEQESVYEHLQGQGYDVKVVTT